MDNTTKSLRQVKEDLDALMDSNGWVMPVLEGYEIKYRPENSMYYYKSLSADEYGKGREISIKLKHLPLIQSDCGIKHLKESIDVLIKQASEDNKFIEECR